MVITEGFGSKSYQFNEYSFVFIFGIILFIIGFLIVNRRVSKNDNVLLLKDNLIPKKNMKIFMAIEIIVFIIFLLDLWSYIKSHYMYNFWFSYKWSTELGYYQELSIMPAFRAITRFLACLLFANYLNCSSSENKKTFYIQLIITCCYTGMGQGRGGIFAFIIPLFIIYVIMKRKSLKQIFKTIIIMAILLVSIFLIYSKLKTPYKEQNREFYLTRFENYISGGLVAFCNWAENRDNAFTYGRCTFRFFYAILDLLGINVHVESIVEPYVENLNGNVGNVYTIYKWYANDFGIIYAVMIQLVLGSIHGILYKHTYSKKSYFYLLMHALLYYPLVMQFFMDEYSTMLSLWIQYIIMGMVFYKVICFLKLKRNNKEGKFYDFSWNCFI